MAIHRPLCAPARAGSKLGDLAAWICCPSCALCQETRTLAANNVEAGVWRGRAPADAVQYAALEAEPTGRCQQSTPREARADALTGSSGQRLREAQLGPHAARCRGAPVGCTRVHWAVVHQPSFQVRLCSVIRLGERMHLTANHSATTRMGSRERQGE